LEGERGNEDGHRQGVPLAYDEAKHSGRGIGNERTH